MKSLFVVSPVSGAAEPSRERRKHQRRMGLPRRLADRRTPEGQAADSSERRLSRNRRSAGNRRRRPDRRIGLSPDLDLYLIGI